MQTTIFIKSFDDFTKFDDFFNYVKKIKEINIPDNDDEFELMLDKISIPE